VSSVQQYNSIFTVKSGEVWSSSIVNATTVLAALPAGQNWVPQKLMTGDYYAQNSDAIQPGADAPWCVRVCVVFVCVEFVFVCLCL